MPSLSRWEKFGLAAIVAVFLGGATITGCSLFTPVPERVHADLPMVNPQTLAEEPATVAELLKRQAAMAENIAKLTATISALEEANKVATQGLSAGELVGGATGGTALLFSLLQIIRNGVYEERRKNLTGELQWQQGELEKLQSMLASMRGTPAAVPAQPTPA